MSTTSLTLTASAEAEVDYWQFTVNATNCTVTAQDSGGSVIDLSEPIAETESTFYITCYPSSGYVFNSAPTITDGTNTLTATLYGSKNYRFTFDPSDPFGA